MSHCLGPWNDDGRHEVSTVSGHPIALVYEPRNLTVIKCVPELFRTLLQLVEECEQFGVAQNNRVLAQSLKEARQALQEASDYTLNL